MKNLRRHHLFEQFTCLDCVIYCKDWRFERKILPLLKLFLGSFRLLFQVKRHSCTIFYGEVGSYPPYLKQVNCENSQFNTITAACSFIYLYSSRMKNDISPKRSCSSFPSSPNINDKVSLNIIDDMC